MDARAIAAALLVVCLAAPGAAVPAGHVNLALSASGALGVTVVYTDPNGSALRYAMDGNFSPLLDVLITNTSQRATTLAQIETAESTPIIGGFFGNRDGVVVASEVTLFESLIQQQVKLLPPNSLTGGGGVELTMDGSPPTSAHLLSVSFANATGPDNSTQPILITTDLAYQFDYGSGSHLLALTFNNSSTGLSPGGPAASVVVSLTTPNATAVTGSRGFTTTSTSNDPWGLGPAQFTGAYSAAPGQGASISFGPSFPTAYAVILIAIAAAAVASALLWRRRRRRRAAEG